MREIIWDGFDPRFRDPAIVRDAVSPREQLKD